MRVENDMRGAMMRRYDDDVECLVKLEIIIFHEMFNKRFFLAQFFFTFWHNVNIWLAHSVVLRLQQPGDGDYDAWWLLHTIKYGNTGENLVEIKNLNFQNADEELKEIRRVNFDGRNRDCHDKSSSSACFFKRAKSNFAPRHCLILTAIFLLSTWSYQPSGNEQQPTHNFQHLSKRQSGKVSYTSSLSFVSHEKNP